MTGDAAEKLDKKVCQPIVKELDLSTANIKPVADFAAWAARTNYLFALEVFTINYDLLIEAASRISKSLTLMALLATFAHLSGQA